MIQILAEEYYKLILKGITDAGGTEQLIENLINADFIALGALAVKREEEKNFLKLRKVITLSPYTGTNNLVRVKDICMGFRDIDLQSYGFDKPQSPGGEIKVQISEMQPGKNGDYQKIFNANDPSIWFKIENQNRILQIFEEYDSEMLKNGAMNLFPIEKKEGSTVSHFVMNVYWAGIKRHIFVNSFNNNYEWQGVKCHRVFKVEVA
jgi:hypothetical protein